MLNLELKTKVFCPPLGPEIVSRPELIGKLRRGMEGGLVTLTGPTGAGKTTLLADWGRRAGGAAAWLSLDAEDNDPVRFWSAWVVALRTQYPEIGAGALGALRSENPRFRSSIADVLHELEGRSRSTLMVLDDYQEITNDEIHDHMNLLLGELPQKACFVLALRDPLRPSLRSQWAERDIFQVGPADLRFTPEYSARYLNEKMRLGLSDGQVAALHEFTQGWIAGLQLAALSLRLSPRPADFIAQIQNAQPPIYESLFGELLGRLPAAERDFLLRSSVLEHLNGELCGALTGEQDPERRLANLYAQCFPLVPLDERQEWFRFHPLFAQALERRAEREFTPESMQALHRLASEREGQVSLTGGAFRHALAGADYEAAVNLIQGDMDELVATGQISTLLARMRSLPSRVLAAQPRMCIMTAWALAFAGGSEEAQDLLQKAEGAPTGGTGPGLSVLRGGSLAVQAFVADREGRRSEATSLARKAEDLLPDDELNTRSMTAYVMGRAHRAQGDLPRAIQACERMERLGREAGNRIAVFMGMCERATVRKLQGRLRHAENIYQAAKTELEQRGERLVIAALVDVGWGDLLLERNQLAGAEAGAQRVVDILEKIHWGGAPTDLALAYTQLARVCLAKGELDDAQEILDSADRARVKEKHSPDLEQEIECARIHLWLARREMESAVRWAKAYRTQSEGRGQSNDVREPAWCRVMVRAGRPGEALERLETLRIWAEGMGRHGSLIEISNLIALALEHQGQEAPALETLSRSLCLAAPEGYMRTFLQEGPDMAKLLNLGIGRGAWGDSPPLVSYVTHLTEAFEQDVATQMQLRLGP